MQLLSVILSALKARTIAGFAGNCDHVKLANLVLLLTLNM